MAMVALSTAAGISRTGRGEPYCETSMVAEPGDERSVDGAVEPIRLGLMGE